MERSVVFITLDIHQRDLKFGWGPYETVHPIAVWLPPKFSQYHFDLHTIFDLFWRTIHNLCGTNINSFLDKFYHGENACIAVNLKAMKRLDGEVLPFCMMDEQFSFVAEFILFQISGIASSANLPMPAWPPELSAILTSGTH
jgi:hypothetical protein